MSKKAITGGLIMLAFALLGLFGQVTLNGEVVRSRFTAFVISVVLFPLLIIVVGYFLGFLKSSIIAFFREAHSKFFKKDQTANPNQK